MKQTITIHKETENSKGFKIITSGVDTSAIEGSTVFYLKDGIEKNIGKWENIRIDGLEIIADVVFNDNVTDEFNNSVIRVLTDYSPEPFYFEPKAGEVITQCKLMRCSIIHRPPVTTPLLPLVSSNSSTCKTYIYQDVTLWAEKQTNNQKIK